jgi:hypothetical protein
VRIFRPHPVRLARALIAASVIIAAGCGGGGSSGSNPVPFNGGSCDPGTSISLAFPNNTNGNFPTGVPTNIGRVEIVASDNNNIIANSFTQFDTFLVPQNGFGGNIQGGFLTTTADPNGPHPYTRDFYYNSSIPGLQPGVTYTVYINVPSNNCQPIPFGQFST